MKTELIFNGNSNNLTPNIPQEKALIAFSKSKQNGQNRALLVLPSGTGKTRFSAFETYNFSGNILYIAHLNEILIQAKEEFKKVHNIKDEDIGFYNGTNKQYDRKITFASIQTISKIKNLERFARDFFDYIIFDEWHHSAAPTAIRVLKYFKPKHLLAMTATPYRLDGKDILQYVNYNIPYQMELKEGIETGELVPPIFYGLWDDVNYSDIKWGGRRYTQKDLDKKLLINQRDNAVIKEVKEKMGDRKCIGFCCSIKHIERCVKKFNKAGFSTVGLHHRIEDGERKDIVTNFREGKYQIIFTVDLFNEGVDFPGVEGILFLRPTCSKRVFFQQLGRGLRKKEGKENIIVLDFIGNYVNAYLIRKWLGEIVPTRSRGIDSKPEYIHNVPEVHFDERVIDLFEIQKPLSDEKIIEDFYELKKELGRVPRLIEFRWGRQVRSRWGSWHKFFRYLGETPSHALRSLEEIKQEINKAKKILGRIPKSRECVGLYKKGIIRFNIHNACCAHHDIQYEKLLYEMGEKPTRWNFVNLDIAKKLYNEIKKDKKRIPRTTDFPFQFNPRIQKKIGFKCYQDFVRYMGDEPRTHKTITKEEFISDVKRIWKNLGRQPSHDEYRKLGKFSISYATKKWGKWTKMMNSIGGENLNERGCFRSQEELEREYVRVRNIVGKPLLASKFYELNKLCSTVPYKRIWKKWTLAVEYIEKKYFDKNFSYPQKITKQDCIDAYIEERKKLKKPVPISRIKKIPNWAYVIRFGSLTKAKEECEKEYIKWKKRK